MIFHPITDMFVVFLVDLAVGGHAFCIAVFPYKSGTWDAFVDAWFKPILQAVRDHPAVDFAWFATDGDTYVVPRYTRPHAEDLLLQPVVEIGVLGSDFDWTAQIHADDPRRLSKVLRGFCESYGLAALPVEDALAMPGIALDNEAADPGVRLPAGSRVDCAVFRD